jgi:hypothetical protein
MEITFNCPKCGEVTVIGEEFVGQSGECRACGALVTVTSPIDSKSPFVDRASARGEPPLNPWDALFRPVEESRDFDVEMMTVPF